MVVKKKKAKKKADAGDEDVVNASLGGESANAPLVLPPIVHHYVTLDMRLLNWSYLNFKIRTKTSARLFTIKKQIEQQHGPISDLRLCKGHFAESNEMRNDLESLEDYGIQGAPESEPEVICIIHYDFKPKQHDNPLLLAMEQK